jgi:rhodanese-related sulfurtransferase
LFSLPGKPTEKEFKSKSPNPPYLLLDVRDPSEFAAGHILTAENYPKTQLSRANFETPSLLKYVSLTIFKCMQF